MNFYIDVLKRYAEFTGRAARQEFWMFFLINFLINVALSVVDGAVLGRQILQPIYSLAVLVPGLAVGARRLHDTGKSGWLQLVALIPCVGAILLIVWWAADSQPGSNQYGPNPKGVA